MTARNAKYDVAISRAEVAIQFGELGTAATYARRALAEKPDNLRARAILGECLLSTDEHPPSRADLLEAIKLLREVSVLDPVAETCYATAVVQSGSVSIRRNAAIAHLAHGLLSWAYNADQVGRSHEDWQTRFDFLRSLDGPKASITVAVVIEFMRRVRPEWLPEEGDTEEQA